MNISNGAVVQMTGSIIDMWGGGSDGDTLVINDTSKFTFGGTKFKTKLSLLSTQDTRIVTDEYWISSSITIKEGTRLYIKVNTQLHHFDDGTGVENTPGYKKNVGVIMTGNSYFELSGNETAMVIDAEGQNNICLFKDLNCTVGYFWLITEGADSPNSVFTFDNCQLYLDADNDIMGMHLIEEVTKAQVNIINGSVLEFSGHSGITNSMGQPIQCTGKLVIRDSRIIDNVNDNIPFGPNYATTVLTYGDCEIYDSIIENKNWDTVGTNTNLAISKYAGVPLKVILQNVIFNNSEINSSPIRISYAASFKEAGDYICESGCTFNSSAYKLEVSSGDAETDWEILTAACPI
jgi:hypothetical protein